MGPFSQWSEWNGSVRLKNEVRGGSPPSPWGHTAYPASGQQASWGSREQARAVSRAPEPSPRPCSGPDQALRQWWHSPPSPSLWPNGSSHLHRMQSVGPAPWCTAAWGACRASGVPGPWLPQQWQLSRLCGPGPEGAIGEIYLLLARSWISQGDLGPGPFLSDQRITSFGGGLQEHCYLTVFLLLFSS